MSKGNRIKGKFSGVLGCRLTSHLRASDLRARGTGLGDKHRPKPRKRVIPKITKTQRKLLAKLTKGFDESHPLERQAAMLERGTALYMGLVSSITMQPEGA